MAKTKIYKLSNHQHLLRDAESVDFHAENNDYFGTAATVLKLLRWQLENPIKKMPPKEQALIEKSFQNLEDDLLILQKNYHIKANTKKSQIGAKGKLKSQ